MLKDDNENAEDQHQTRNTNTNPRLQKEVVGIEMPVTQILIAFGEVFLIQGILIVARS